MGKIAKMPTHLANMIAAGEVVERPSSVVKELVENAIDAHAKNIWVSLLNGGLDEIKVVDDGEGMDKDDVELAFLPHATSKIKTEYDLSRILSLGFRGEAIASIAAVSRMQIISSMDGLSGYQVTYQAGSKQNSSIVSANKGTTVIVQHLFFNTPARLKYLKPAKNELASITFLMDRIALAHPEIRFHLQNDGKNYLSTTGSKDSTALMGEIYGLAVAKNLLTTSYTSDGVDVKLILVKPEIYRSNKLEMTFIVNGRYVKNYPLSNAIIDGYKTFLPIGKYPICVVYYSIDPTLVDVNVHPSKTEIKLSNEEALGKTLTLKINEVLSQTRLIPTRTISKTEGYQKTTIFDLPRVELKEEEIIYKPFDDLNQNIKHFDAPSDAKAESIECLTPKVEELPKKPEKISQTEKSLPHLEYVGQAFGTYLIFQASDGLYLMDQHAAAERVNYEKYYEILGKKEQPVTELLVPILISFTKNEALFVEDHLDEWLSLGFVLEPMSELDYVVRQIPLWAKLEEVDELVREVLNLLVERKKIDVIAFRDEIAKQISCKASIKANHALDRREIDTLVSMLNCCKHPYTCPHGRPTIIRFTTSEIEKMFERIQS